MKFKSIIFLMLLVHIVAGSIGQQAYTSITPPSPNASSLGKFAETPVNLYNGIPTIEVPLYTIKVKDFSLPISLSYHAGGVKVSEIASWVGLGWALNAGGVITRSVIGNPDEANNGYVLGKDYPGEIPSGNNCLIGGDATTYNYETCVSGDNDTQPDMFYFNFNGYSGKFVLDKKGAAHTIPYCKMKIEASNFAMQSWRITTEDGVQYTFSATEYSHPFPDGPPIAYISSWYLTDIKFPNSTDVISLEYLSENYNYQYQYMVTSNELLNPHVNTTIPVTKEEVINRYSAIYITDARYVSKITFPGGNVTFDQGNYRYDLQSSKTLGQVSVNNQDGVVKRFKLSYNYTFGDNSNSISDDYGASATTVSDSKLRLCLKSIQEFDKNAAHSTAPYIFSYYIPDVPDYRYLPDRNSNAQDHWGFYNGQLDNDNTTLIPMIPSHVGKINGVDTYHPGASRYSVEEYAKTSTLCKIQYPTGGYTKFEFEQNDAQSVDMPNDAYPFQANLSLGSCHFGGADQFTIDDNVTNSVRVTLSIKGTVNNFTPTTCNVGTLGTIPTNGNPSTYIFFQILNITNPSNSWVVYTSSGNMSLPMVQENSEVITLPSGTYQVRAVKGNSLTPITINDVGFSNLTRVLITGIYYKLGASKKVGGLRIKSQKTYDPVANSINVQTYSYLGDDGLTSGKGNFIPIYDHLFTEYTRYEWNVDGTTIIYHDEFDYDIYTSYSCSPLAQMQGGNVGYGKVTVYYGQDNATGLIGTNGKTEYYFNNPNDYYPINVYDSKYHVCYTPYFSPGKPQFPFAPSISLDWERGLLNKRITFKSLGNTGGYQMLNQTINTYKSNYLGEELYPYTGNDVKGAKFGITAFQSVCSSDDDIPHIFLYYYQCQYYFIPSRFSKLVKAEEYTYDDLGVSSLVSKQEFSYDNLTHMQLTRSTLYKSDGNVVTTQNLYPDDYTNTTGFIGDLKSVNMIAKPVETVQYITKPNSVSSILGANITSYKTGSSVGLPDKVWKLELQKPMPLSQFRFSNQTTAGIFPQEGTPDLFSKDSHYPLTANNSFDFDANGNITNVNKAYDLSKAYLWDYKGIYPIAEVKNALQSDAAYTSFEIETNGTFELNNVTDGGWTFLPSGVIATSSKTGSKSYSLNMLTSVAKDLDANKKYQVFYWSNGGAATVNSTTATSIMSKGGWTLYMHEISNSSRVIISGNVTIDELRLHPVDAQMTSCTYAPLIGKTSETDVNNRLTYYEYDSFGRLKSIKDQDGNIIKMYDYKYQQTH